MRKFFMTSVLITIITSAICSIFGQTLLKIVNINTQYANYLIILTIFVLLLTKYLDKKFEIQNIGMQRFIQNSQKNSFEKIKNIPFIIMMILNTLLAHLSGASVGREGVAIQIGGAVGSKFAENFNYQKHYFVRLGMICGFSALFQTPIAALIFVLEVVRKKDDVKNTNYELLGYAFFSFISCYLSHFLGLEKFFVPINVNYSAINFLFIIKVLLGSILAILVGILFVLTLKQIKKLKLNPYYACIAIIIVFFLLNFRYNSLGTNLISAAFTHPETILQYDFLLKLFFTCLCVGIGFKGGEVTPLFAIGASFGVIFATLFQLPIALMAALGYVLVFGSSTKTWIAPMFLLLEVFGWQMFLIGIIPCVFIFIINKKYSIYTK